VEVKTGRQAADGRWHFTLQKTRKCDHRHADIVLILAVMNSLRCVPFVIPVPAIGNSRQICIGPTPDRYEGKYAQFRQQGGLRL
jgi:hypothetical protein